jgi:hypothetical protein
MNQWNTVLRSYFHNSLRVYYHVNELSFCSKTFANIEQLNCIFFSNTGIIDKFGEMFCPFSSRAPPKANVTQTEQQRPLNLKHLSEAVKTLTSPPVSTAMIITLPYTCAHNIANECQKWFVRCMRTLGGVTNNIITRARICMQ